jgi:putative ABC transport system substrate-binding protein
VTAPKSLVPAALLLGAAALAAGAERTPRVGVLFNSVPAAEVAGASPTAATAIALMAGLRERGWSTGKGLEIVWRTAGQRDEKIGPLLDELLAMPVDVLVVSGDPAARAAFARTRSVPIVMTASASSVESGLVRSLSRPGLNVTGLTSIAGSGITGKRLSLLKQAVPGISRVGVLVPTGFESLSEDSRHAGRTQGIELVPLVVDSPADLEHAFQRAQRDGVQGMLVEGWAFVFAQSNQVAMGELSSRYRIPTIHAALTAVDAGALLAYGSNEVAAYRRAAHFIDRILRGANPGDIPVEQPLAYELHVNLRVAKALGVRIPASMLLQADRVVE